MIEMPQPNNVTNKNIPFLNYHSNHHAINSNNSNVNVKLTNGNLNSQHYHQFHLNMNRNNNNTSYNHHYLAAQNANLSNFTQNYANNFTLNNNNNHNNNNSAILTPGRKSASPQFFRSNFLNEFFPDRQQNLHFTNQHLNNNFNFYHHQHHNNHNSSFLPNNLTFSNHQNNINNNNNANNVSYLAHHNEANSSLKIPTTPTRSKSLSPSLRSVVQPPRLRHKQDRLNNNSISNNSNLTGTDKSFHKSKQDEQRNENNKFLKPNDFSITNNNKKKSNEILKKSGDLIDNSHYFEPIVATENQLSSTIKLNGGFNMKNIINSIDENNKKKNETKTETIKKPLAISAINKISINKQIAADEKVNNVRNENCNNKITNPKDDKTVKFKLPLNVRRINLCNYPSNHAPNAKRSYSLAMQKIKGAITQNSDKSINVLKKNIQFILNEKVKGILQEFTNEFIQPAFTQINLNCGKDSISNQEISFLIGSLLDEAKTEYLNEIDPSRLNKDEILPNHSLTNSTVITPTKRKLVNGNDSLLDEEEEENQAGKKQHKEETYVAQDVKQKLKKPTNQTKFILGKLVNDIYKKYLQSSPTTATPTANDEQSDPNNNTSKSIYSNFPHLFRYEADQDDRHWLNEKSIIKRKNLKCFLLLVDEVEDLFASINIYHSGMISNDSSSNQLLDLDKDSISKKITNSAFTLPDSILYKLNKKYTNQMRNL